MNASTTALVDEWEPADPISRASVLIACYSAVTEDGIAALANGDLDAVDAALAARAEIVSMLGELLDAVQSPTDAAPARNELLARLRGAQALDQRFQISLGSAMQTVSHDLELLDGEETVRSAYGQTASKEGRNINLVR